MFGVVEGPINRPNAQEKSAPVKSKPRLPTNLIHAIDCQQGAVRAVRFNGDGNYCLTCGNDKTIKLWNPEKQIMIKKYAGHGYDVLDAASSNDNCQLASCGSDKSVMYWDVASGQIIRRFRGHAGRVNCVQFNEESTVILSGSVDSSVRAWDCRSKKGNAIQIMDEAKDSISCIQVSDHEVLTGSIDGKIRRYDLRIGSMHSDNVGSAVTSTCFTKDGQCTLTSSHDSTIRLLDVSTGEMLGEYKGHGNGKYMIECALNRKDDHVISGSEDGHVYMWDLVEATVVKKLKVKTNKVIHSLSMHPEKDIMMVACENRIYMFADDLYELPDD